MRLHITRTMRLGCAWRWRQLRTQSVFVLSETSLQPVSCTGAFSQPADCHYEQNHGLPARRFPPPWSIEELNDARFVVTDSAGQKLALRHALLLLTTILPVLPQRNGCASILPNAGGVGAVLQHFGFARCGMGNVRLRGESVSSEHGLSRSLCRSQSNPSLNPRMSRLQLQ